MVNNPVTMKLFLRTTLLALGSTLTMGCSLLYDKEVEYEYVAPPSFPVLNAVGIAPIPDQRGEEENIKVLRAMKASKLEAYRELSEQLYGLRLQGVASVEQMVVDNDALRSKVEGVIRGAKVVKSYRVGDNYVTEMELDMERVNLLIWGQNQPRRLKNVRYY